MWAVEERLNASKCLVYFIVDKETGRDIAGPSFTRQTFDAIVDAHNAAISRYRDIDKASAGAIATGVMGVEIARDAADRMGDILRKDYRSDITMVDETAEACERVRKEEAICR